jgi:hypothetical protein
MEYTYPAPPPEALTIARRLDRAGYPDTSNSETADWLASLKVYEALMATATRKATFKQRQIDLDGVVRGPDDQALAELAARVAALDAHATRMRRAVAYLDGLLSAHEALPATAEGELASRPLAARYRAYRRGDAPTTLHTLVVECWRLAVRVREAYRVLSEAGKADAVAAFGPFCDANGDAPLLYGHTPQREIELLDKRAKRLGVSG